MAPRAQGFAGLHPVPVFRSVPPCPRRPPFRQDPRRPRQAGKKMDWNTDLDTLHGHDRTPKPPALRKVAVADP